MFIFMFLLIVLSISRVLLKPISVESEFEGMLVDDETRYKRQTQFFELLHQAIEKYANSANEHLATLRALANYKHYDTFVKPEEYSHQTQPNVVAAANPENMTNIKCTKVNLCFLQEPHSHTAPRYNSNSPSLLAKSQNHNPQNSQESSRYIPYNWNDYVRLPMNGVNLFGLRNMHNPRYSQVSGKTNFTSLALNRSILENFLHRPTLANRKQIVLTSTQNEKTKATLGNDHTHATPAGLNVTTEKPPTTVESKKSVSLKPENTNTTESKEEVKQTSTPTTTETAIVLGSHLNNSTSTGKPNSCSCLKNTSSKPQHEANLNAKNTATESNSSSIEIQSNNSAKVIADESVTLATSDPQSSQNLNLLFLQLDLMAHNESKEDLKQILKELNDLKYILNIKERTTDKINSTTEAYAPSTSTPMSTNTSTTLKTTTMSASPTSVMSFTTLTLTKTTEEEETPQVDEVKKNKVVLTAKAQEPPLAAAKVTEFVAKMSTVASENENTNITEAFNDTKNPNPHKSPKLKNTNIEQSSTILKNENSNTLTAKSIINTTTVLHTVYASNKSENNNSSQPLAALKDLSLNLNLNESKEITALNSSQPLPSNITASKDLSRQTNEMNTLVLSSSDGNIAMPDMLDQGMTSKDQLNNFNQLVAKLNNTLVSHPLHHTNNGSSINSTITISVSSNGSLTPSDKNLEINGEEQINLDSSKVRSIDMKRNDSKYVNVLDNPLHKDPSAVPILSEIYSLNRKLKKKPPPRMYLRRIEENPLMANKYPSKNLKAIESDDYSYEDDDDDVDTSNEENFSTL